MYKQQLRKHPNITRKLHCTNLTLIYTKHNIVVRKQYNRLEQETYPSSREITQGSKGR